jgi:hypothetical protein
MTDEHIFSQTTGPVEDYQHHFHGQALSKVASVQRTEGRLFGYPSCCIEHFIHSPYHRNGLDPDDQAILFHWACPGCRASAALLSEYRRVYDALGCQYATPGPYPLPLRKLALAASLTLFSLGTLNCDRDWFPTPEIGPPNQHLFALAVDIDADRDFLEDRYEAMLRLSAKNMDTDLDGLPDGPDLALSLLHRFQTLSSTPQKEAPYIEHFMLRGLEQCNICQETVNMGYAKISNPLENLSIELPYIFLHHFLTHGSFSWDGNVHGQGRVNTVLLNIVLRGNGESHLLGAALDPAEQSLARTFGDAIDALPREVQTERPYVIEHQVKGLEMCHCCGQNINMGFLEIIHPVKKIKLDLPFISVHYLHCGGFSYQGDVHTGRCDAAALAAILDL